MVDFIGGRYVYEFTDFSRFLATLNSRISHVYRINSRFRDIKYIFLYSFSIFLPPTTPTPFHGFWIYSISHVSKFSHKHKHTSDSLQTETSHCDHIIVYIISQADWYFKPCVNGDMSFLWESLWLSFLSSIINRPRGHTSRPILTHNGSNDVGSRKDVPFGGKNRNFWNPCPPGPQNRQNLPNFGPDNFRSISRLTLGVLRVSIPYFSSEPNKSVIVNRQCGDGEFKYVPKFCIGVQVTSYRACAMTILHRTGTLEANISKTLIDRGLVTMEHE